MLFGPLSLLPGLFLHGGLQMVGLLGVMVWWVIALFVGIRLIVPMALKSEPDAPRVIERIILEREWVQPTDRR